MLDNILFTSDEHFGHKNIIKFCNRPFSTFDLDLAMEAMTLEIISRHNYLATENSTTYHLGDMFWRTFPLDKAIEVMNKLKGRHVYIRGNHEELLDAHQSLRDCFVSIHERLQIYPQGAPKHGIVLDHYAGRVWHDSDKGNWQLYGHTHGDLPETDPLLSFDVGVDANGLYPVPLERVAQKLNAKRDRIVRGLGISTKQKE